MSVNREKEWESKEAPRNATQKETQLWHRGAVSAAEVTKLQCSHTYTPAHTEKVTNG